MPTKKPRVAVTLKPETHEVIERLAALQGRSRGSVIAELLDAVTPALSRTVALMDAAQQAPKQVQQGLAATIEQMERELVGEQASALAQLDWVERKMGSGGFENPRVVTRGSGVDNSGGQEGDS